jgi:hypothetical protein
MSNRIGPLPSRPMPLEKKDSTAINCVAAEWSPTRPEPPKRAVASIRVLSREFIPDQLHPVLQFSPMIAKLEFG